MSEKIKLFSIKENNWGNGGIIITLCKITYPQDLVCSFDLEIETQHYGESSKFSVSFSDRATLISLMQALRTFEDEIKNATAYDGKTFDELNIRDILE